MKLKNKQDKTFTYVSTVAIGSYAYFIVVDADGKFHQATIDQFVEVKAVKKKVGKKK